MSVLKAKKISSSLGYDPLLISLYDPKMVLDPHQIIKQFIERSLSRAAVEKKDFTKMTRCQTLNLAEKKDQWIKSLP